LNDSEETKVETEESNEVLTNKRFNDFKTKLRREIEALMHYESEFLNNKNTSELNDRFKKYF
jgi:hypothetical protein